MKKLFFGTPREGLDISSGCGRINLRINPKKGTL
jgi:hypothetical protein